jgi:hypothetical protein
VLDLERALEGVVIVEDGCERVVGDCREEVRNFCRDAITTTTTAAAAAACCNC